MNNLLNNCKIVNIVWIDRGIILSIIFFILKYYDELINKTIIITEDLYRIFINMLFPKLKIENYKKHKSYNFYFNIRKIIKNQDVIINFIKNYKHNVNTNKIYLVPWYNMYDPLIAYRIDKKDVKNIDNYKIFINNFSKCNRANYFNHMWDALIEYRIMTSYNKFNPTNTLMNHINIFNNFIQKNYQHLKYSTIQNPQIYYQNPQIYYQNNPNNYQNNSSKNNEAIINTLKQQHHSEINTITQQYADKINTMNIDNDTKMDGLIDILNKKIKSINDL